MNSQYLQSVTEHLEQQIENLHTKLQEQHIKDEINLLKSRATRAQDLKLKDFITKIMPFLPPEVQVQGLYLRTKLTPTFQDTVQWLTPIVPSHPKIPLTKHTLCAHRKTSILQTNPLFPETKNEL